MAAVAEEEAEGEAQVNYKKRLKILKQAKPIAALTGIVKIHAQTIFLARTHLTADVRLVNPTPAIEPQITWVVLTGIPKRVQKIIVNAPELSAQKPCIGFRFVNFVPLVFTTLLPPARVPSAIVAWESSTTQNGTKKTVPKKPPVKSSREITPIVFWASFVPWLRL